MALVTLGEEIRKAREAKRMTLRALARGIGVSAPFMSDVEHDRRQLSDANIARAAVVLGIDRAILDAACGYTRDLAGWLRDNPELIQLLRDMRAGRPARIGECDCAACYLRRGGE